MSERSEWPSAAKMAELRERGLVAVSQVALAAMALVGVVLALFALGSIWRFPQRWLALDSQPHAAAIDLLGELGAVSGELFKLFCLPVISAAVLVILAGLIQSRFLFRPASLALQGGRLWDPSAAKLTWPFPVCLAALAWLTVGIIGGALLFTFAVPQLLGLLNQNVSTGIARLVDMLKSYALIAAAGALAMAMLGWIAARTVFMLRHRISRREVQNELGE